MCKPFLKWVGGKTQLLTTLSEQLTILYPTDVLTIHCSGGAGL